MSACGSDLAAGVEQEEQMVIGPGDSQPWSAKCAENSTVFFEIYNPQVDEWYTYAQRNVSSF